MSDLKYSRDHEWVRLDGDIATVGITNYAQEQLGDVVFVELPDFGKAFEKGGDAAVVESVKAASEVYAPVSGEVIEVNSTLEDDPELVNRAPTGDGWFFKMKLSRSVATGRHDGRGRLQRIRGEPGLMRYLPLTDADRQRHAGDDRRPIDRQPVSRRARKRAPDRYPSTCRITRESWRWSGLGAMAAEEHAGG